MNVIHKNSCFSSNEFLSEILCQFKLFYAYVFFFVYLLFFSRRVTAEDACFLR